MLTVIIAEKHVIEQYEKFKALLTPFQNKNIVFCEWNRKGSNIDEMFPSLHGLISFQKHWRAVVVNEDRRDSVNPFAYIPSSDYSNGTTSDFTAQCEQKLGCYERAVENPLTKLSAALCGTPLFAEVIEDSEFKKILAQETTVWEYMFSKKLETANTRKIVAHIKRYRMQQMKYFVSEDQMEDFFGALGSKNIPEMLTMMPAEKIKRFLGLIGLTDSMSADPGYWMSLLENTKRAQLFERLKQNFTLRTELPKEVICISPRTCDTRLYSSKIAWENKEEEDYSKFVLYNMYNEKMSFLVYDMPPENCNDSFAELFKFHTLLQILALHGNSASAIGKNRLYIVNLEYRSDEFKKKFTDYIARLKMTAVQIRDEYSALKEVPIPEVDNETSRSLFEKGVEIPVELEEEYDRENLMAKYDIGLSVNCPRDEGGYWRSQYSAIKKLFIRFLREPRRAVKAACKNDFRFYNRVQNERIFGLNENQKEDIAFKRDEEERAMVEIRTSGIYDTENYMREMKEADKELQRGIGQRMTRKKTVVIGLIAGVVFLFGFLPLLLGSTNTVKSFLFSLSLTGITVGVFLLVGFIYLFRLRKKLINRFKHFNYVMSGIYSEIQGSMKLFSEYLSHACNVMRETSVLNYAEKQESKEAKACRVLQANLYDLEQVLSETYALYSQFSDDDESDTVPNDTKVRPFDYDFTAEKRYAYTMFENSMDMEVEYMLKGYTVDIPIDYVKAVTLKREELYD